MNAWDRQPRETERAFAAFVIYRDQPAGKRSLREVGRESGKSGALIDRWSRRWSWVNRAAAWDSECDRVRQEAALDEIGRLARRHAQAGALLVAKAIQAIAAVDMLTPSEAVRALALGAQLELRARGLMDTESREVPSQLDLLALLERRLLPAALAGDTGAIDRLIKIQERRAAATGTDAPATVNVGVESLVMQMLGGKNPIDLSPATRRELAEKLLARADDDHFDGRMAPRLSPRERGAVSRPSRGFWTARASQPRWGCPAQPSTRSSARCPWSRSGGSASRWFVGRTCCGCSRSRHSETVNGCGRVLRRQEPRPRGRRDPGPERRRRAFDG